MRDLSKTFRCADFLKMLGGIVFTVCLLCMSTTTAQFCETVINRFTAEFNADPAARTTYSDLQAIQHGQPVQRKCNFIRARTGFALAVDECLNVTGVCQNVRASSAEQIANILRLEVYERTTMPTNAADMLKKYGPGLSSKKPAVVAAGAIFCDPYSPYRTIDGSCNNLIFTHYGMQGITQRRYIPSDYDDGIAAPRVRSRCTGVTNLPSPRLISNIVHAANPVMDLDNARSLFVMQMGQFLAHDLVLTHLETRPDGTPLQCCGADAGNPNCFAIPIPPGDPIFTSDCMDFSRSMGVFVNGRREQVNSQTAFFDLSMVYGVTNLESIRLRTMAGDGELRSVLDNRKLPRDVSGDLCKKPPIMPTDPINYYCPIAGDVRVNEQPGLSSLHTIFMREHNRLARALRLVNPSWSGERVFQEARKINIGQWQHIVFNEYLPAVLGPLAMLQYNLWVTTNGYRDTYWAQVDPSIVNSFAAAVLRFGHSLVPNMINLATLTDGTLIDSSDLRDNFFEPLKYHSFGSTGMDHILKWMSNTPCPLSDRKIENSVRQFLFFDSATMTSLDLASLNIQRGRDHGLPGYNWFRTNVCNLPRAFHFGTGAWGLVNHSPSVAQRLSQAYACTDDIDLFTGHMTERRLPGSMFGPTGQCLMAYQMRRLRDGDRFFYERYDFYAGGFTPAQLSAIKRIRMSDIFCLNTVAVAGKRVQRNMFFQPGPTNDFIDCASVPGIDITLWDV